MKLALLNTTIATTDGSYEIKTISLEEAKSLVTNNELDSAIGHESTAQVMSTLLDAVIKMDRQQFEQQKGQYALVFKLKGRPPEGSILTYSEIEEIGYEFKLMKRTK
jgi:KaiC/GvpD/RAD55 family RecA-like ATPase